MDSAATPIVLPLALGIIMFGLGLTLTPGDFRRVLEIPKAVAVALACQLVLLPLICFGLVVAFDLSPALGIGMMLLAASPGGTIASLYSHLFRGDVALNISLAAVNSVLAVVTLPIVANLAIAYYGVSESVSVQFSKVLEVFVVLLAPVAIGMAVRARSETVARKADRPVRIIAAVFLTIVVVGILVAEIGNAKDDLASVGLVVALFCLISLAVGYLAPLAAGVTERQAIACSFEIGLHNTTLAIYIAVEVLDDTEMSVAPAVHGLLMLIVATAWGFALTRLVRRPAATVGAP